MKNIPQKIYLNTGKGTVDDFKNLSEVTWCKDKINKNDIEYTLTLAPIDSKEGAREFLEKKFGVFNSTHPIEYLGDDLDIEDVIKLLEQYASLSNSDGWVSVEERMPENNDNVLIFANKIGEQIEVAFYNDSDKEWQGLSTFWLPYITHWQPLPTPPKQ